MQKRAPTLGNLLVIILFTLSCFGLLLFLWESFGGPLPLKPKEYRFTAAFPRTLALTEQSDVRISGVEVGHVVAVNLGKDGYTHATIELSSQYAPIRANTHAILRQKTLLGETYVQLIPQGRTGPYLGDGAQLADSNVEPFVTLDDILSLLNRKTRRNFQAWMQYQAAAIAGRGEQINASLATFEPFVEHGNTLLEILASQEGAVKALVRNTGVVFDALAGRDHQLEGLISNGERTFHAAAEESQAFAETWRALPPFEASSIVALRTLDRFSVVANPYLEEFRPVERQLSSLLAAAKPFAPQFDSFLTALGPLDDGRQEGTPVHGQGPRSHRPGARKRQAGAAQPRPVPAVAGRIRARGAGVLRQPHRRHRGLRRQRQHPATRAPKSTTCARCWSSIRKASRSTRSGWARTAPTPTSTRAPSTRSATAVCRCSATAPAPTRRPRSADLRTKRSPRA